MHAASRFPTRWTNKSVLALAGDADPIAVILARARDASLTALDKGWTGPPFDPVPLARLRGIEIEANSEVRDARTVPIANGRIRIEFNPERPRGRMRYSIAHEIAHTLFPDCAAQVRSRSRHRELGGDAWQLEALCNIAAAEFLMPSGSVRLIRREELSVSTILEMQRKFDVSTEALVLRIAETSDLAVAAFCASPTDSEHLRRYRLDYFVPSRAWRVPNIRRSRLPDNSVVAACRAIGFSTHGVERWSPSGEEVRVDAIGIPPYPGGNAPRVVGLVMPAAAGEAAPCFRFVHGDATAPDMSGHVMIVHVVNDKTPNWGGNGFAASLRRTLPNVQEDFQDWAEHHRPSYRLGNIRVSKPRSDLSVASVVAQHGYGPSAAPRIRYSALREGLTKVAAVARQINASIHMPRIGTGQAGGEWAIIEDIVRDTLCVTGLTITVYDMPGSVLRQEAQTRLPLNWSSADAQTQ